MGWIKSAHGIRGEIYIHLKAGQADWVKSFDTLYLLRRHPRTQELETFTVHKHRPHKDGLIVSLKGIETRNQSEELEKATVYIPTEWLEAEGEGELFLHEVLNFKLVDPSGVELGTIDGFATNGSQDLLRLKTRSGKEALIPFVEAFLMEIDFENRQVKMDLPPGLLDLEDT